MTTTINISLPKDMYEDAKKLLVTKRYASISELIRDSLRKALYAGITENGFTKEFEDEVLKAEKEPDTGEVWETEEDIDKYFRELKNKIRAKKNAKNKKEKKVRYPIREFNYQ